MRIAALLLSSIALAAPALAERPALKADVLVHTDVVRLGDLVDGLGEKGQVSLFAAPGLGRSGTIQAFRIIEAARDHGIDDVIIGDVTQVTVRRAGRSLSYDTVRQTVADAIFGEYGLPPTTGISIDQPKDGFFVAPGGKATLRVRNLEYDQSSGRFTADLVSAGAGEDSAFLVTGSIADEIDVPVIARDVGRNAPLSPADVTLEKRPRASIPPDAILDPMAFHQMTVKRAFRRGDMLRVSDITATEIVARGDLVTIIVEIPGMTLATRGKALQGGVQGAVIGVQNMQTKRVVSGVVAGPGRVIVDASETPAQIARNEATP
jgi:flagellar basal body P-ring formation protein FlgA